MPNDLSNLINGVNRKRHVKNALAVLYRRRNELTIYGDVEGFATAEPEPKDLIKHFSALRSEMAAGLWPEQLFIGSSVLDELLFEALIDQTISDPVAHVFQRIVTSGVHEPGMIVYPVHSFGVLGFGVVQFLTQADAYVDLPEAGVCLTAQTNSIEGTLQFLEHARSTFGINKSVPRDSVKHHRRSSLDWLEKNQLLAVKVHSFSGYTYENQALLTVKLEIATSLIFMLATLQPSRDNELLLSSSSSRINNFQTLDINHYLVLERTPSTGEELNARRIPMNVKRSELVNLCDLQIDIDPDHWSEKPDILGKLVESLDEVGKGYTRAATLRQNQVADRMYRKLFGALSFYRRSFHSQAKRGEPAIFLATAFEMLLTDYFSPGVKNRLKRRYKLAVASDEEVSNLSGLIGELYDRRSETVHQGKVEGPIDLRLVQKAFVFAFIGVVARMKALPQESSQPIADILGDHEKEPW